MCFRKFIASVCICLAVAGCASTSKKRVVDKEAANKRWTGARAAVLGQLATDQYKSGNFDKSRQSINEAIRLSPDNPQLRLLSAKLAIEQAQLELADKELQTACKLDPKLAEADYFRGVVYQRWQQSEQALDAYKSACEKAPSELSYLMAQAEMLVTMDR